MAGANPTALAAAKARLRRCLLARRARLTPAEIEAKSAAIAAHLGALPAFRASHTLMVYLSLPQEVQTQPLIALARQQGKRLVVPVVREQALLAVPLPGDPAALQRGPYGILEPRDTRHVVPPSAIEGVLVPGVAFDPCGGRLGFGKGYYDRFLKQLAPAAWTCGLAFHCQLVPQVPMGPADVRVHYVVTEAGVIDCHQAGKPA
ncbi:MAG: 5-formyltetrahydrofolate cyclo-ligase [Candidatus Tectimicrobiota bacterium]|nr:MAG: 5-formyltetrahydrofolate cyclo-ligase [Candidatus Tectomicrobia bacterium]